MAVRVCDGKMNNQCARRVERVGKVGAEMGEHGLTDLGCQPSASFERCEEERGRVVRCAMLASESDVVSSRCYDQSNYSPFFGLKHACADN